MKVHNIVAFLLIGLATATRPPYGSHGPTSAKAQVGKAILVRIPLDSDPQTPQQQYQGDYHEPTTRNSGQNQGYGYESKDEPETRGYTESRPLEVSPQGRPQGYGSYGASSVPDVDPRQKMVLLVPDANKETNQGYTNQQSTSNYAPRQQVSQPSEEIVYSKPLSPSGTKITEKKNQYQNSHKEHHKVPLILITLNKEEKLAVKPTPASRRIPTSFGKSWQPMITQNRRAPLQPERQNYETDSRLNQQASYNNEWQQGQPIRQESYKQELTTQTTSGSQWQSPAEVQYDRPQRNPQSTEETYNEWKAQSQPAAAKNNFNRNIQSGPNGYGSQPNSYSRPQEQSQTSQEAYPQQYPGSYQVGLIVSTKPNQPSGQQPEQQSYQGGYYQRDTSSTGNQQESNYQGSQASRYPQQVEEPKSTQINQNSRYPQQSQESRYQHNNQETRYPQQNHESSYQQTNSESRYPQQSHESRYEQTNTAARHQQQQHHNNQESRHSQPNQESRYQQNNNQETRYPEQNRESSSYQQTKTETRYPQVNQETRYPQQTQESRYSQNNQESRYPQASQESRYTQTNQESRYPEQAQESRYPEQTQESRHPQTNQESRYPEQTQESRYPQTNQESRYPEQTQESRYPQTNQESRYPEQTQESRYPQTNQESRNSQDPQQNKESRYENQPSSGNNYAQTSDNRFPLEGSIGHGSSYNSQTPVRSNQDQPQETRTKQEIIAPTVMPIKTQWRQASSYVPEQVEPTRTSENYEKPVGGSYNQGYSGPQSAGTRSEDSWEPQASSERATKTRAEKTKGVVLLLLSNDDKDGFARRSSNVEPVVPAV